jgi:hypothetical protein
MSRRTDLFKEPIELFIGSKHLLEKAVPKMVKAQPKNNGYLSFRSGIIDTRFASEVFLWILKE